MPTTVGRFAPTPSGPLHFGSLVTAVGSWLDARHRGGDWFVRIDDLDAARTRPGAADSILRTLEGFGLQWTGPVHWQSQRRGIHDEALAALLATSRCYRCTCTRKEIGETALVGADGPLYIGTCRRANHPDEGRYAWRIDTTGVSASFEDRVLGHVERPLESYVGDFVVRRSDLVHAYHVATVVDDRDLGVTDVVRGADLIPSTLRQVFIGGLLGIAPPTFAHLPMVVDTHGRKLSKSSDDRGVDAIDRSVALHDALEVLGQCPPAALREEPVGVLLRWALEHWDLSTVPTQPVTAKGAYAPRDD
jgi:glutamyl-Q tRNA(Asp) synthetase